MIRKYGWHVKNSFIIAVRGSGGERGESGAMYFLRLHTIVGRRGRVRTRPELAAAIGEGAVFLAQGASYSYIRRPTRDHGAAADAGRGGASPMTPE